MAGVVHGEGMDGLAVGFGLGFLVALQLGPMSLLLIRSTLRSGLRVGLAVAAGIALVDGLYAGAGAAGAAQLLEVEALRLTLGLLGAAVLVGLGWRALVSAVHVRAGLEGPTATSTPRRAFRTSVAATASNPLTIASWAAVFAAAQVATSAGPVALVVGVLLGSASWVVALACAVAVVRRNVTPTAVRVTDGIAGAGTVGLAGVLAHDAVTAA